VRPSVHRNFSAEAESPFLDLSHGQRPRIAESGDVSVLVLPEEHVGERHHGEGLDSEHPNHNEAVTHVLSNYELAYQENHREAHEVDRAEDTNAEQRSLGLRSHSPP